MMVMMMYQLLSWESKGTPPKLPPPENKALIAGLIKENQRLIVPDHKAGYFLGGKRGIGGWAP